MADQRIHPSAANPPPSSAATSSSASSGLNPPPPHPPPSNPVPPPPSYVVRFPREQILRYPPPENAAKLEKLRRKNRRSCCRRFCCLTLCLILLLVVAAAVSAAVMYLVFGFKSPEYTVTDVSIRGVNLTSSSPISPAIDVSIRADNPNGKVGIYYLKNSAVNVLFNGVELSGGVLPAFYQPRKNVTVMRAPLAGNDVVLDGAVRAELRNAVGRRRVPLVVNVEAPVKIKVGSARTWEITAKVKCDVVVDGLNVTAVIVSKDCDYSVRLW